MHSYQIKTKDFKLQNYYLQKCSAESRVIVGHVGLQMLRQRHQVLSNLKEEKVLYFLLV